MTSSVSADRVSALVGRGARLLEVLPRREYEEQHLSGAISAPLKDLDAAVAGFERTTPVVVYCWDSI
jgi:rhodanese-related sulfurtransferase